MKGAAVGTHQFRHVASCHFGMGEQLKRSYHRIVSHRTSLYNDFASKILITMQFQYLIKTVLDDRVRDSGRNISYRSTLSEHLFHLRVHEDGAAGSEVAGSLRLAGELGKIAYRITHVVGKGLDECSAARTARLVEFHAHHSPFLNEDSLHVLSADVEDKADIRHERSRRSFVRHCFDNAAVEAESRLDEFFAVTCRAGAYDFQFSASQCSFLLQGVQSICYCLDRISQIQAVIGKDNISRRRPHIHSYCNNLRRSRTRVNTNHNLLFSFVQRFGFGSEFRL